MKVIQSQASGSYFLFPQEPAYTNISSLKDWDFDTFATHTNILMDDFVDFLQPYYDVYMHDRCKPFYNLSLAYNTMTGDKKFRFLLITMDDEDRVFVPYKVIQILKTKQIRFFGLPISKNCIKENEEMVFKSLNNLSFSRFVLTSEAIKEEKERLIEYDDYFYTLDDKSSIYKTSKYRSKNYINKLLSDPDVRITFGSTPNTLSFSSLRQAWKDGMLEHGSSVSTVSDKHFTHITASHNVYLRFLCIYHCDSLVSLQVFLCNEKYNYADCLYIHHLWKSANDTQRKILSSIVEIQKYLSWEYLYSRMGITRVYLAGCRPSEHRLLTHKERISDGKIEYYITK